MANAPFTPGQYNAFKNHVNLEWLRTKARQNQAVAQDLIRAKIVPAIESAFPGRTTDICISWVADQVGTPWGNVLAPNVTVSGRVHVDAVCEVEGQDAGIATAVKSIFNKTAEGRSSPGKKTHIRHIHAGAHNVNLVFDYSTATVLGIAREHFSGGLSNAQDTIFSRCGGPTLTMRVTGKTVSR